METKICTKCGQEKLATNEYFSRAKFGRLGLKSQCKECAKEYNKLNAGHIKESKSSYYRENKAEIRDKHKEYYEKNKESALEYQKEYRKQNATKIKEYQNIYRSENRGYFDEYFKERYRKNKGDIKKRIAQYQLENRSEVNRLHHMRRARAKKLANNFKVKEWTNAQTFFKKTCAYCGEERKLTQDHFWPLSRGGEYTKFNIIPACQSCNSKKHNKPFKEWYPTHESYSPEREAKIFEYFNQLALENGGWGRTRHDLGTVTVEVINEDL